MSYPILRNEPGLKTFGPRVMPDGVLFRLWAPKHKIVWLKLDEVRREMNALDEGWHELFVASASAGQRYRFELPDGTEIPDPASRYQPEDVHGPSEVVDPAGYAWRHAGWLGRPWEECVIYELHVGTFTQEGTFRALCDRLDHLIDLGVTAIELMPIADFPGSRNWGYDGTLLFAPDASYGRPEDLKAFIDAAHGKGLMVFLDVVYNHFGPDGNYLPACGPIFTDRHHTPWGSAVNYDGPGSTAVRALVVQNALFWIEEYRFDGLRFDAVHALMDDSPEHILQEIARRVRAAAGDRHVHLLLENEANESSYLPRSETGGTELFTAQWNDDVHHVLHAAATGEAVGYYEFYAGEPVLLGRALAEGFAFQGEAMGHAGSPRGEPSAHLPSTAFVSFVQNHDQVGNRAFGDRITAHTPAEAVRAAVAIYLLAPQVPMLFMGEEWAASQPFMFFCDFDAELAKAVREGRRAEFAKFPAFRDPEQRTRIPDPGAHETFQRSKLVWEDMQRPEHAEWHAFYRRLLRLRRTEIVPRLHGMSGSGSYDVLGPGCVRVEWTLGDGSKLMLHANLSDAPLSGVVPPRAEPLFQVGTTDTETLGAWSVTWHLFHSDAAERAAEDNSRTAG